jgi:transcriptional regulator with XRE-family HTH domain
MTGRILFKMYVSRQLRRLRRETASVANNVRRLREARGLSQHELAVLLRVAVGTVARWERGAVTPTGRNRMRLAKRLGVEVEQLGDWPKEV